MAPTLAELESELSRDPKSRRFYELAREYQKQGRMDEAMALCERGLGLYPSQWQARILLAQLYIGKGRLEEARAMVERVLLPLPDNVPANHLAADIYRALGDSERALKHYRIVDLLDPGRAGVEERIAELSAGPPPVPASPAPPSEEEPAPSAPVGPSAGSVPAVQGTAEAPEPEADRSRPMEESSPSTPPPPPAVAEAPPAAEEAPEETPLGEEPFAESPLSSAEDGRGGSQERAEEEWLADTAAFDRELLGQEETGREEESLAQALTSAEETGPLQVSALFPEGEEEAPVPPAPSSEEGLSTATLAELYEHQGFPEKAVEIYQRILLRDPDNRAARDKIHALLQKMAGEAPEGPAVHQEDVERALRRKRVVLLQEWLRCVREGSHV